MIVHRKISIGHGSDCLRRGHSVLGLCSLRLSVPWLDGQLMDVLHVRISSNSVNLIG